MKPLVKKLTDERREKGVCICCDNPPTEKTRLVRDVCANCKAKYEYARKKIMDDCEGTRDEKKAAGREYELLAIDSGFIAENRQGKGGGRPTENSPYLKLAEQMTKEDTP